MPSANALPAPAGDAATNEAPSLTLGLADLAGRVFRRDNVDPLWTALRTRATAEPPDFGAAMDLADLLQLVGQRDQGLDLQNEILAHTRYFRHVHGDGRGLRLLVLLAPGDFMSNTPVDFLLTGSDVTLDLLYLEPDGTLPANLPDHDVAMVAIGESDNTTLLLAALDSVRDRWPRSTINHRTSGILAMRRDLAAELLEGEPTLLAPVTQRTCRTALADVALGGKDVAPLLGGETWPIIVRPVGSHAGAGLERIADAAELAAYLAGQPVDDFYIAPFIDYRSADARYRKYRVVFVAGEPFLAHMAVSDHWMVHYLNAGMLEDADKREEEALAMRTFDKAFAQRHRVAFAALNKRFDLDYFGIDCAETPDGRLLVFETDNALIIHDMDPPDVFPYKSATVRRLFTAFQDLLARRAGAR